MPVHNWLPIPVGLFHHFHQSWTVVLAESLNDGVLPPGYFALVDQRAIGLIPDVLALKRGGRIPVGGSSGGTLMATPPKARFVTQQNDREIYASRANRVAVRNQFGEVAALIEIVSPGNKDSKHALRAFVAKAADFLTHGVNLLVIDLHPPTTRDPQGIHKAIWDELHEEAFVLPPDKRLTVVAYAADVPITAYVEPIGVGDALPALPLYLEPGQYIPAPLEATYQRTWEKCPKELREIVESPGTPEC